MYREQTIRHTYKPGDTAFLVESGRFVQEGRIVRSYGGMCAFCFSDTTGGIRVPVGRLFPTREEAETSIERRSDSCSFRHPWM